ncbi:MAG: hypothetical protein JXB34_09245 [Bacteroidales bacterium]|nr:hypothetical protein [Bacteroidales bacterium]
MLAHIHNTIAELKAKIKFNVDLISHNQQTIKNMLQKTVKDDMAPQFEAYNHQNRQLMSQNNDLLNVQLTLLNFVEKYKNTAVLQNDIPIVDIYSITDLQEVFDLTIKGIVPFDESHPHFCNPVFIDKLIAFYQANEDYELCDKLKKLVKREIQKTI